MRTILRCMLSILAVSATVSAASANPFGISTYVPAQPRDDSADLAALAPPSNRATAQRTYGDATFARRSRASSNSVRRLTSEEQAVVRARCPARTPRATYLECTKAVSAFFRKNMIYTPSYVSAPQVFDQPANRSTPILPPVTAFFLDPFRTLD